MAGTAEQVKEGPAALGTGGREARGWAALGSAGREALGWAAQAAPVKVGKEEQEKEEPEAGAMAGMED